MHRSQQHPLYLKLNALIEFVLIFRGKDAQNLVVVIRHCVSWHSIKKKRHNLAITSN